MQPLTISRIFAQREIPRFAQPRINGTPVSKWQDDVKTRWPDGSLRHVLVSFAADLAPNAAVTVDFIPADNPCSAGDQNACNAAALDQNGMLAFNGANWGAKFQVKAEPQGNTTVRTASGRSLIAAGHWTYWLRGPVVTQAIVEDATTARAADFGWKEKKITALGGTGLVVVSATAMSIPVLDGTDLTALPTPFTIQLDDENISISSVSGNTLTVAARGVNGTTAVYHGNGSYNSTQNFVYAQPLTWLTANLAAGGVIATVNDASKISLGDIISIDGEHMRVCAINGNTLTFGSGAAPPCAAGDSNGRTYDGTGGTAGQAGAQAHNANHFVYKTTAMDRWSDAPSDRYRSLHAMFVLTFYAGYPGVKEEFVLENDWADRAQDQYYDVTLLNGGGEANAAWSSTNVKQAPYSRWRKTFWDGAAPGAVNIDYNLAYMTHVGTVPYDPTPTWASSPQSAIAQGALDAELAYAQFSQGGYVPAWPQSNQCNPDTAGFNGYLNKLGDRQPTGPGSSITVNYTGSDGLMIRNFPAPGGRGELGLFPRWDATYLYAMSSNLPQAPQIYSVMTGMGECAAHVPLHYREYDSSRLFCNKGASSTDPTISCSPPNDTAPAFGRVLSIDTRPTVVTMTSSYQNAAASDLPPNSPGIVSTNRYLFGGGDSTGHSPSLAFLPYVITGDYFFLQELQYWGSWSVANASQVPTAGNNPPMWVMVNARHADWGYLAPADGVRGQAWALREVGYAALMSPDGTPEKQYFTKKLDTNIAILEGKYDIRNGNYYNSCTAPADCSYWTFGRQYKGGNASNPLHFENVPYNYMGSGWVDVDYTRTFYFFQPFMQRYLQVVLGHLGQLGFSEIRPLRQTVLSSLVHQVTDPAVQNPAIVESYMLPNTPCKPEGTPSSPDCSTQTFNAGDPNMFFQSWANWYQAISASRKSSTRLVSTDGISGYAVLARAAAAFSTDITDGPLTGNAAWQWLDTNLPSTAKTAFATTPMWAFAPMGSVAAPQLSALSCSPVVVQVGQQAICTLSLKGQAASAASISLSVQPSAVIAIPPVVVVAAGATATQFTATATLSSTSPALITASIGTATATSNISVQPPPSITKLMCTPASLAAFESANCVVTLAVRLPYATGVTLSGQSQALGFPSSLTVAAGQTAAQFTAVAGNVTTTEVHTIVASSGTTSARGQLTIQPRPKVTAVTCMPSVVMPNSDATCSVHLAATATSDVTVALSSDSAALQVPSTTVVPRGVMSSSFLVHHDSTTTTKANAVLVFLNGDCVSTSIALQSPRFWLRGVPNEFSTTLTGTSVKPTVNTMLQPGSLTIRGVGLFGFTNVWSGDGMSFGPGGGQNQNATVLSFSGSSIGNLFGTSAGEIDFYLKSRYSLAERQALPIYSYRWVFESYNNASALHSLYVWAGNNRLAFVFTIGGITHTWWAPAGTEDQIFGKGAVAKVQLAWEAGKMTMWVNGVDVTGALDLSPTSDPMWPSSSTLVVGSRATWNGGFFGLDDGVADFRIR